MQNNSTPGSFYQINYLTCSSPWYTILNIVFMEPYGIPDLYNKTDLRGKTISTGCAINTWYIEPIQMGGGGGGHTNGRHLSEFKTRFVIYMI